MKNMRIFTKLVAGFVLVALTTALIGIVSVVGFGRMQQASKDMYDQNIKAIGLLTNAISSLNEENIAAIDIHIYAQNAMRIEACMQTLSEAKEKMEPIFSQMEELGATNASMSKALEGISIYRSEYEEMKNSIIEASKAHKDQSVYMLVQSQKTTMDKMINLFEQSMDSYVQDAEQLSQKNTKIAGFLRIALIAVIVFSLGLAVVLGTFISRSIVKPLEKVVGAADAVVEGNLEIDLYSDAKDETGVLSRAFHSMLDGIRHQVEMVDRISMGDLTMDIKVRSDYDKMNIALRRMLKALVTMFSDIIDSAKQVSAGAQQIAQGAQILAQGSTQQGAAVQELSATISEVADKTKVNVQRAEDAAVLGMSIKKSAELGSEQMDQMVNAVHEIKQASNKIGKVIKVIDDIAFQTNILALNAAVEAARAGAAGKGFAVVAEEVRNLAAKSAEAAKDTSALIENSIQKAELGARIAEDTAASLAEIVDGINKSSEIATEIAKLSEEQSEAISQINFGIDQVAQVVHQNSATSQQSAAASEQMASQADLLLQLMEKTTLPEHRYDGSSTNAAKHVQAEEPVVEDGLYGDAPMREIHIDRMPDPAVTGDEYGKY